jgi:phospholipid/cholesterol/gamma-HCH transport system permease protein
LHHVPSLQWLLSCHPYPERFQALNFDTPPGLKVESGQQGKVVRLSGQWTAFALARDHASAKRGVVDRLRSVGQEAIKQ